MPESNKPSAALLQSLANNHAFLDGNKRVAFATLAVFVRFWLRSGDSSHCARVVTAPVFARTIRG